MAIQDGEDLMRMDHSAEEIDAAIESINEIQTHLELHDEELDNKLGKTETAAAAVLDGAGGNIAEQFAEDTNDLGIVKTTLGMAKKNFVQSNCRPVTRNGVEINPNSDGSISIVGVSAISTNVIVYTNLRTGNTDTTTQYDFYKLLPPGEFILSGSTSNNIALQVYAMTSDDPSTMVRLASVSGVAEQQFTVFPEHIYTWVRLVLENPKSTTYDTTVYPMIRPADITDDTYEPYALSVAERLAELESRLAALESAVATTAE